MNIDQLSILAIKASVEAGKEILRHYNTSYSIEYKTDSSPLTTADKASHETIIRMIDHHGIPVLSEEGKDIPYHDRKLWTHFWLVDPLDGTKEFINGNGEFSVNIALIQDGSPVMGVVYVPVSGILYYGSAMHGSYRINCNNKDIGAINKLTELKRISERLPVNHERYITIMGSRSHQTPENSKLINSISQHFENVNIVNAGSSLKFCRLAEGAADIYPRLGPTMEWDTAAGHAVCKYAGNLVLDYDTREEMEYNKENLLNPWFIAIHPNFIKFI
jgi:3'(2'), 5'-bisphosphate nucleotidase